MKFHIDNTSETTRKVVIEEKREAVDKALNKAIEKVASNVQIPGFRKGKAPRRIIKRRVGSEMIEREALSIIIPELYSEVLGELDERIVNEPDISDPEFSVVKNEETGKKENQVTFEIEFEVIPPVELGDYKNIRVSTGDTEIDDNDIDDTLNLIRERHSEFVIVDDRETVEKEDMVIGEYEIFVDEESVSNGVKRGFSIVVGSNEYPEEVDKSLESAKVGEEYDVPITLTEEYARKFNASDQEGNQAIFKYKIEELKVKKLPELDDEFAKNIDDFETIGELKESIRSRLMEEKSKIESEKVVNELLEKIIDSCHIQLPESILKSETDTVLKSYKNNIENQGISFEEHLKVRGIDEEEVLEDCSIQAENMLKRTLVLDEIANKENIEVSEEEVDKIIKGQIENTSDKSQRKMLIDYLSSDEVKDKIRNNMQEEKVLKFLVENNKQQLDNEEGDIEDGSSSDSSRTDQ